MIYALAVIGLTIGFCVWSMCRVAAKYDEDFERLHQHEQHSPQRDLTGTDDPPFRGVGEKPIHGQKPDHKTKAETTDA
jgi:hypothetical protein